MRVGAVLSRGPLEHPRLEPVLERPGFRFVRVPDQKRVYAARFGAEISTAFEDWIETDLLQLDVASITSITNDAYSVDEGALRQGAIRIIPGDTTAVEALFDVSVVRVHTMRQPRKTRRVGKHAGRKSEWKKAIVQLAEGHTIEFFEGV